jgi:hypothetical protein
METNPIFAKYAPEKLEYKVELVKQLELNTHSKLSYYIEKYVNDSSGEKLFVAITGKNLDATAILLLDKANEKLLTLREKGGMGYHGAELKNLKFNVRENELIFENVDAIID